MFGHTHEWGVDRRAGIHLVNLPPTSYVFGFGRPSGWIDARIGPASMTLSFRSLDPGAAENGRIVTLDWRDDVRR